MDLKNAYGSILRSRILEATQRHCPAAFPYVSMLYGNPTPIQWSLHSGRVASLDMVRGLLQGDSLSNILLEWVLHPLLQELWTFGRSPHSELGLLALPSFVDDIEAVVSNGNAIPAFVREAQRLMGNVGASLQPTKTIVLFPNRAASLDRKSVV